MYFSDKFQAIKIMVISMLISSLLRSFSVMAKWFYFFHGRAINNISGPLWFLCLGLACVVGYYLLTSYDQYPTTANRVFISVFSILVSLFSFVIAVYSFMEL